MIKEIYNIVIYSPTFDACLYCVRVGYNYSLVLAILLSLNADPTKSLRTLATAEISWAACRLSPLEMRSPSALLEPEVRLVRADDRLDVPPDELPVSEGGATYGEGVGEKQAVS